MFHFIDMYICPIGIKIDIDPPFRIILLYRSIKSILFIKPLPLKIKKELFHFINMYICPIGIKVDIDPPFRESSFPSFSFSITNHFGNERWRRTIPIPIARVYQGYIPIHYHDYPAGYWLIGRLAGWLFPPEKSIYRWVANEIDQRALIPLSLSLYIYKRKIGKNFPSQLTFFFSSGKYYEIGEKNGISPR